MAHHLARHDLLVEESLAILDTSREALLLSIVDKGLDCVTLLLGVSFGLLLLSARLAALVSPQVAAEVGMASTLVIEVGGVG